MRPRMRDPWRTKPDIPDTPGTDDKKPSLKEKPVVGSALSDDDRDWDLHGTTSFILKAPKQDYAIVVRDANSAETAVDVLMRAVQNRDVRAVLDDEGFKFAGTEAARPVGFSIGNEEFTLWLPSAYSVASGFKVLVTALLRAISSRVGFKAKLETLGLTPLLP